MSITAAELILYGVASIPIDDASTTGGAIDLTVRPVFTQFGSSAKLSLTSDGTDTRLVDVVGRLASGAIATETVTLTNAVEVLSVNTYERIESVKAQTTSASRTVTLKQGAGGSTIATIPVNEKGVYMFFQRSASSGSITDRYEKAFWKNTDATLSLLGAQVTLTADPAAKIKIGLATAVDDSGTVANRTTAPGGVSFVDDGVAQNVPGTDLAAGSAIGTWVNEHLAANDAAQKSTFTTQLSGSST